MRVGTVLSSNCETSHIHLKEVCVCVRLCSIRLQLMTQEKRQQDISLKLQITRSDSLFCILLFTHFLRGWGGETTTTYMESWKKKRWVSVVLCITELPKALEEKGLGFFFCFVCFLCYSLWVICKWTSLNWFNHSIGICNSMLSAMRDSKRL